jgi:hypothetical protein
MVKVIQDVLRVLLGALPDNTLFIFRHKVASNGAPYNVN